MNKSFSLLLALLGLKKSPRELPSSVDCLGFDKRLYNFLSSARYFDDPIKTLEFALSQSNKFGVGLEFGVYSGRTLKVIAKKYPGRTFGFDSFEGLPEYWRDGFPTGTFRVSEIPIIEHASIIDGLFQDTLETFLRDVTDSISFIRLDADLYSSTKFVLRVLNDSIEPGCIIQFDEFINYPGFENHEYLAFSEWCSEFSRECLPIAFTDWHEQMAFKVVK
jgi:hypothetical protein